MNENKMGTVPVNKLLVGMATPMVLSMLVGALYNVVDSLFVSHYGENALSAVSLAFPIQNVIIATGTGVGVGINALLSRYLGQKEQKAVNQTALHGILLGIVFYIIICFFGLFCVRKFYLIQTPDAEIVSMGVDYLTIICVFGFGQLFQLIFEKILQSTGRTAYTMVMQIVGAIINIILNPIFIFGYFGLPAMGTKGAAFATVIGQIVAMLLGVYFNLTKNKDVQFGLQDFQLNGSYIKAICEVGIPTIIMQSMSSIMCFGIALLVKLAIKSTCDSNLRKEIAQNQKPGTLLSHFGPEKVPGFVHCFYRELFCNSPLLQSGSVRVQPQAHVQRLVHAALIFRGDLPGALPQAVFVQGADLFQQHHAILGKAGVHRPDVDVGGQAGFVQPGCNGSCDHGGAVPVADLVLHDQHRAHAALFRTDHRRKVRIKNFSSVYLHGISLPVLRPGGCAPLCDAPGAALRPCSTLSMSSGAAGYAVRGYSILCRRRVQVSGGRASSTQKASATPPSWLSERWAVRPWCSTQAAVRPEKR